MNFLRKNLNRRKQYTGPTRLVVSITILMFLIYMVEERILSNYSENVPDMKLPYLDDVQGKGKSKRPVVTPVIVLGYMRSGSSLAGDILQQNSEVFYIFEPLHDLQKDYFISMEEFFPESMIKHKKPTYGFKEDALQVFRAWFACDIKYIISDNKRYHFNFFKYGTATKKLAECIKSNSNETNQGSRYCTRALRTACLKSKVRVIKTIRIRLAWLTELMAEYQELKIIHLVRDPRAIISSWTKFGECTDKHGGVPACTHYLCSNMEDDLIAFDLLSLVYPERLHRIVFEELASKPIKVTKRLYNFIGMELSSSAQEYVRLITSAGKNSTGIMSTIRANSSASVDAWRATISDQNLFIVQKLCKHVMDELGYYHFIKP